MNKDEFRLNEYYDEAGDWGYDRYISSIASRNRYIVLVVLLGLIALAAVTAVAVLVPLKETVPVIYERTELGKLREATTVDASEFVSDELIDLSYVENYFLLRERYDSASMTKDNYKVQLWNSDQLNSVYMEWFRNSPDAHYRKLGKQGIRSVHRKSIVKLDDNRYQIRFSTTDTKNGKASKPKHWVSILEFTYSESNIPNREEDLHINTVGFMVTKYIKQKEIQAEE